MFFIIKVLLVIALIKQLIRCGQLYVLSFEIRKWFGQLPYKLQIVSIIFMSLLVLYDFFLGFILILVATVTYLFYKRHQKSNKAKMIKFYGYKIFKFLLNQVTSGIKINDAIKSMYKVVDDKSLRKCLLEVAAYHSKTNDIEYALGILKTSYKGMAVDTLCMAIEQGIYTGTNFETLKKIEELLFKTYINEINLETQGRKKQSIVSVLMLCTVVVLMIAIPVFIDIVDAFNQIFLY